MGYFLKEHEPEPTPPTGLCNTCLKAIAEAAMTKYATLHPFFDGCQVACGFKFDERTVQVTAVGVESPVEVFKWEDLVDNLC